ncbi:unnamed protein product [Ectocarpus sp. CCAP 1310/34]|nr:unnamed protein product [Ectocarpus sp. CCAP 1310/34]
MNGLGAPAVGGAGNPTPLLIRILMIGDSSVGKTSLVLRYDKRGFNLRFTTTIGVDYSDRLLELDGRQVKLQIWDTAGQERFHSLTTSFFKRAEGFVLVYDVSNRQSFESVSTWMKDIVEQGKRGSDVVICGNKCDLQGREVAREEGEQLAAELGVPYMETSAKENLNVEETFGNLASRVKTRLEASQAATDAAGSGETLRLNGGRNGGVDTESLTQRMESCCT